jgi:YD repeat-containing protein
MINGHFGCGRNIFPRIVRRAFLLAAGHLIRGGNALAHRRQAVVTRPHLGFQSSRLLWTLLVAALGAAGLPSVAQAQACVVYHNFFSKNPDGSKVSFATPEAACAAQSNGPVTNGYDAIITNIYSLGAPEGDNLSWWCVQAQIITGSSSLCTNNPGYCGVHISNANGAYVQNASNCGYYVVATRQAMTQTSCRDCVIDPINPGTGAVYTAETDVRFHGYRGAIAFRRYYNSADTTGADGVPGWRHSYDRSIQAIYLAQSAVYPGQSAIVSPEYSTQSAACTQGFAAIQASVSAWASATATYENGVCVLSTTAGTLGTLPILSWPVPSPPSTVIEYDVIRDDGQILRFTTQNGAPTAPPGVSLRLAVTGSGYTLTDDQDNVETYNSSGVLQSITTRSGVVQTLSYDSDGLWSGIADSFGNSLTVTRNVQGSIAQIAANGGGTVSYTYDDFLRLSTVTNLDGTTRSYAYSDSSLPNALTALVDENGTTYSTWTYNPEGQAVSTQEAGGADASTLTYNSDGSTTWTDPLGALRTLTYTRIGDINEVVSISGSQCQTCSDSAATTYDGAGWIASQTDYDGNVTCYANDPTRGLELVRVEGFPPGSTCPTDLASYTPASGTAERKISTTWSSSFRQPVLITEATRTTAFNYDANGNLLSKSVTDTTSNVTRTWTYTYDSYGRVLTVEDPRQNFTTYTYYTARRDLSAVRSIQ